jgi:DNA mismatch repair protein MSH6
VEEKTLAFRNQTPSNGHANALSSGLCSADYNRVNLFSEQDCARASFHEPRTNTLRSSTDEFVKGSLLFPEPSSNCTPLQEHPKKLLSESPNKRCLRASSLFEEFDVQTPSQNPSKRVFLGPSHGDDTPLRERDSEQTLLQHSSKKLSLNSVSGGYARSATTSGLDSNGTPTEQPSKKLWSQSSDPLYIKPIDLFAELDSNRTPSQNHSTKHIGAAATTFLELDSSPLKPETPAMRASIPHLKRVREEQRVSADNQRSPLWVLNKMTPAHPLEKKFHDEMAESARSKFEWLNPSNIKDANKRHPNDPLHDKSTLFIPPDALRKMSTSQKQYWNIKSRYMDVVLFFKVVRFIGDSSDDLRSILLYYRTNDNCFGQSISEKNSVGHWVQNSVYNTKYFVEPVALQTNFPPISPIAWCHTEPLPDPIHWQFPLY